MPRKVTINTNKSIVCGAPKVGKSSLVKSHLQAFKTPIYLDLKDPRTENSLEQITANLERFCVQNGVDALAIDNYTIGFPLPKVESIFLISEKNIEAQGYAKFIIHGLDFEEYLSFDRRHQSVRHIFNSFLKDGSLPEISLFDEHARSKRKQEILRLICESESEIAILHALIHHMGAKITTNQLYTNLKRTISLSKDRIYSKITDYQSRGILHLVEKFEQKNAPKKLFFWDFTLANALRYERNFTALIENMLFLELVKSGQIFYSDRVDFIAEESSHGFVVIPFATPENIHARLSKIREEREFIDTFIVITMGFESEGENLGTPYIAIPFWEFVLSERI